MTDTDEPNARTRLNAHLSRIGANRAVTTDAVSHVQVQILRHVLTIVETAMRDEGIPPATISRVTDLIIYGGSPNPAEAAERERMTQMMIDQLQTTVAPTHWREQWLP